MRHRYFIIPFILFSSCGRLKNETENMAERSKEIISSKANTVEDKIIRHFDPYEPDSKWNRKRFLEFFGLTPEGNATHIYSYSDEIGADHTYAFSFVCSQDIVDSITKKLQLKIGSKPEVLTAEVPDFQWWPKEKIEAITPYFKQSEHETYEYLWFDKAASKVWYLLFDM